MFAEAERPLEELVVLQTHEVLSFEHQLIARGAGFLERHWAGHVRDNLRAEIVFVAGARKAVGVSDQNDDRALGRLELYLAENPSLDALIWISSADDDHSLRYRFVRPQRAEVERSATFQVVGRSR